MKQKTLFLITFCIAVIARAMTWHELSLPYNLAYYAYVGFWGIMMLRDTNFKIQFRNDSISKVLLLLLLYFVVFGLVNITNLDFSDTAKEMFRSILMMFFVFISCYWMNKYKCLRDIITYVYVAFASLMIAQFLMHITDIDLVSTISTFWNANDRYRIKFGFAANNIASEYAVAVILLSFMSFSEHANKLANRLLKYLINIVMFIIIIANNSRGILLALVFVGIIYILLMTIKKYTVKKVLKMLIVMAIVGVIGIGVYCNTKNIALMELLVSANRYHFMDNIEIMEKSGRWLTGLGTISGEFFRNKNYLYGLRTNYVEIYYLRVFITSGIIGSVWILYTIIVFLKRIRATALTRDDKMGKWIFLVFVFMLFYSLFACYLFSYGHATAPCFLAIVVSYLQTYNQSSKQLDTN